MAVNNEAERVILLAAALIATFALGAYDGGSGLLQRYVFPKRYWSKEVRTLQEELQNYNKLSADNAVLFGQADMKAKFAVAQVLRENRYSQEVIDGNRNEIEKAELGISAMCLTDAKEIAKHLKELIRSVQAKLAEATRELSKRR
jgi:hypothetical protein